MSKKGEMTTTKMGGQEIEDGFDVDKNLVHVRLQELRESGERNELF